MSKVYCKCCEKEYDGLSFYNIKLDELDDSKIVNALYNKNPELCHEFSDNIFVCSHCFSELFNVCRRCGNIYIKNELCSCTSKRILSYYNKQTVFPEYNNKVQFRNLRLGLEIETILKCKQNTSEVLENFSNTLGRNLCKFKSDASLGPYGIEIVTMPLYFEHLISLKKKFIEAFKYYRQQGGWSYKDYRTGLHIHISRKAFTSYKHLYNFYIGITKNQRFTQRIAKRKANGYCEFPINPFVHGYNQIFKSERYSRHDVVNFNNKETIEVRVYKGSIAWHNIQSYVEHIYSLFKYSLLITQQNKDFTVDSYRDFILVNKNEYPELVKVI